MSTPAVKAKRTAEDRDASYRALIRDVILGGLVVIILSLAVPAWIIRVEYSKTYRTALTYGTTLVSGSIPRADVLRDRTLNSFVVEPRLPTVLELAEEIVRREVARRESERRAAKRDHARGAARAEHAARPVERVAPQPPRAVPPPVGLPPFDFPALIQSH